MPPKMIKKKSSPKKKPPGRVRHARTMRKQAKEAVRSSCDFLRQVIDVDPHLIFAKDRDGRFTLANQAVADAYGTTIEDLIGKTDSDFNSNRAEIEFSLKMDREVMDLKRERFIPEEVITDAAGKKRWLQTIKRPIIGKDGRANHVLGVSTDITERKKAEEALRESEQRFRAIYDQTYEFIGLLKPDGTLIDANRTALAFRGLQLADVAGKPFWETPWWDISHELQEKLKSVIAEAATGKFVRIQAQHLAQDGAIEEIDFSLTPIIDWTGKVTEIIPEGRRITALTQAQNQLRQTHAELERLVRERTAEYDKAVKSLRESDARLQGMLDHSPNLIFMKDLQGRYLEVNTQFERTFHFTRQDIIGTTDHDVFPPEYAAAYRANDLEVLKAGRSIQFEEVAPHDDGLHTNIVWKFPVRRLDGTLYAICGIATDITERQQAEEVLRQRQRALESAQAQLQDLTSKLLTAQDSERQRIARDLHDDFSQRLAALTFDVASLQRQPPLLPELIGKALEPVREELTQLSDDLRQLAHRLHPSLLKHAGLRPALEEHIHQAMRRTGLHITLTVRDVSDSLPLALATCLFRVFQESLQNVAKHAKATEVLVKLSGSSKGIGLSVRDNGTGFDFYDKSSHQKGLGLTSMKERLRVLNGFLNIHSRPADGTKVCAWIPFQEKTP